MFNMGIGGCCDPQGVVQEALYEDIIQELAEE